MRKQALILLSVFLLAFCFVLPTTGQTLTLADGLESYWTLDETSGVRYDSISTRHLNDNNTVGYLSGAGTTNWWLAGGVSAGDVVAVYQPIGAASKEAGALDLSGSSNDLSEVGTVTWSSVSGFSGFSTSNYYTTNITPPDDTYSIIARFSNVTLSGGEQTIIGNRQEAPSRRILWLQPYPATATVRQYRNGGANSLNISSAVASGVMGIAGNGGYYNGSNDGTISTSSTQASVPLFVGVYNFNGTPTGPLSGAIQALAIYSATLTASQVAAITTAVNDLPNTGQASNSAHFQSVNSEYLSYTGGLSPSTFTIAGWVNPISSTTGITQTFIAEQDTTNTGYSIKTVNGSYVAEIGNGATTTTITHTTTPISDTWYLAALSYNATTDIASFTINTTTITTTHTGGIYGGLDLTLGATSTPDQYCDCALDEWGYWTRELSADDISDLYDGLTYDDIEALMVPDVSSVFVDLPSGGVGELIMSMTAGDAGIMIGLSLLVLLSVFGVLDRLGKAGKVR